MSSTGQTRLSAHGVTRKFANGSGIFDINLEIRAGENVALIGLNGAGKTTLMRVLLGMLRPGAGTVMINDQDITSMPTGKWEDVGQVLEHPLAYPELTVRQNLRLVARLRGLSDKSLVDDSITEFGLTPYVHRRISNLSSGNRQRVGLAAALMHHPQVIILDEPTNGLDPAGIIALRSTLQHLMAAGSSVLVSSHHLDEVSRLADHILVMNAGRIIGRLKPGGTGLEHAFFELVRRDDATRSRK